MQQAASAGLGLARQIAQSPAERLPHTTSYRCSWSRAHNTRATARNAMPRYQLHVRRWTVAQIARMAGMARIARPAHNRGSAAWMNEVTHFTATELRNHLGPGLIPRGGSGRARHRGKVRQNEQRCPFQAPVRPALQARRHALGHESTECREGRIPERRGAARTVGAMNRWPWR